MAHLALALIICTFFLTVWSCEMKRDEYRHEIKTMDCKNNDATN